ncbi:IAA-alanine resistance protein 1 [Impatiens glandulifera]|uniref:IAA-alanine resistance protein 1 n=1 Tax=Impatiens glandulifera TaxID=253017 RepID=UPI001FB120BF|nr:IAA-alanine resistance protein 1 [Impatiens glandulifera]
MVFSLKTQICSLILLLLMGLSLKSSFAHQCGHHHSGSSGSAVHEIAADHHCDHGHDHHQHHHHCDHGHHHDAAEIKTGSRRKLPEEIAEEEDLKKFGFGLQHSHYHDHDHHHVDDYGALELSGVGLWIHAMGCSLLVSLASLICLIILPVIFIKGQPSKAVVDSLAVFGAGAMLGDAFLHQLPHAFGGEHSHSHTHDDSNGHSHSHSMKDLSVGLSVLSGIVVFLIVEKIVRYVQENSANTNQWSHGHHHHHHHKSSKMKDDKDGEGKDQKSPVRERITPCQGEAIVEEQSDVCLNSDNQINSEPNLRKRTTRTSSKEENNNSDKSNESTPSTEHLIEKESAGANSNLVFGYLNLFSDGVHNFTDGIALGSAFLLYGSVGGWSRTLFLLAHELPQEIGDFGILVRSGFSVGKALFFNFLSALAALAGTALALVMGQDPGQSSLIEGFTAGGFIYIAVAGVLAEMNSGSTTLRGTVAQLISLILGMAVALCISLVE